MVHEDVTEHDLGLLQEIERDPDTTQANLAVRLGVAVGTVNWHLRRLIAKGYVKAKRAERKKLRYILTPEGISLRAKLTVQYVERSMTLYRQAREDARKALTLAREQGYRAAFIAGDGDIADVCRLTCLEQGMPVVESEEGANVARIEVRGREIVLGEGQAA